MFAVSVLELWLDWGRWCCRKYAVVVLGTGDEKQKQAGLCVS